MGVRTFSTVIFFAKTSTTLPSKTEIFFSDQKILLREKGGLGSFSAQTKEIYVSQLYAEDSVIFCHSTTKKSKAKNIKTGCITVLFFVPWTPMEIGVDFSTGRRLYFLPRIVFKHRSRRFFQQWRVPCLHQTNGTLTADGRNPAPVDR